MKSGHTAFYIADILGLSDSPKVKLRIVEVKERNCH